MANVLNIVISALRCIVNEKLSRIYGGVVKGANRSSVLFFFTFDETTSVSQTDRSREADEMASHALVSSPVSRTERPPVRCIYVSELHSQSLPN